MTAALILGLGMALLFGVIWGYVAWGAAMGCPFCRGMLWWRT